MSGYTRWQDIRAENVARAGGEKAVHAGKEELLAEVTGRRLAEPRRARGLPRQQVAHRMESTFRCCKFRHSARAAESAPGSM